MVSPTWWSGNGDGCGATTLCREESKREEGEREVMLEERGIVVQERKKKGVRFSTLTACPKQHPFRGKGEKFFCTSWALVGLIGLAFIFPIHTILA